MRPTQRERDLDAFMRQVYEPQRCSIAQGIINGLPGIERQSYRFWGVQHYSYGVPCAEVVAVLVEQQLPILEVGAGTGWWASKLTERGATVIATNRHKHSPYQQTIGRFHNVRIMGAAEAVKRAPEHLVLMVWPPMSPMAATVAHAMRPGQRLLYVGEGTWGCTANDAFFACLRAQFKTIAELNVPQWDGIHDDAMLCEKVTA